MVVMGMLALTGLIVSLVAIHLNWFDPRHDDSSLLDEIIPGTVPPHSLSPDSSLAILTVHYDNEIEFQSFRIDQQKIMLGSDKGFLCGGRVHVSSLSAYFSSEPGPHGTVV